MGLRIWRVSVILLPIYTDAIALFEIKHTNRSYFKGKSPEEVTWTGGTVEFTREDVALAKSRVDKCVIGLQSDWEDTKILLKRFYPWLKFVDDVKANTGMGSKVEKGEDLRRELWDELNRCNSCDNEVFIHGQRRFLELLQTT